MASSAAVASGVLSSTRKSIDSLLAEIGGLLADLTSQEHPAEDEENEDARRVIDVELQRFWQGYYELKRRHDENALSVAVLALTKSGKSTLLNALMGMEVLPMNNVPETARICRITHDAAVREPLLRDTAGKVLVRGEAAVRIRLQQLNSAARTSSGPLSPQTSGGLATDLNEDAGSCGAGGSSGGPSSLLHISAPLVALEGFGPEFGRVTLLDTPGTNEAGEEQLKHQVERLLEGVDCVLYLLDYTKLKTAEEEGLFRRLRAINPQLVARLSSRLFFVINKADASETSEGLDPDEVRNYVADLVTRQLGGAVAGSPAAAPDFPARTPGSSGSLASVASGAPTTTARAGSGGGCTASPGSSPSSPAAGGTSAAAAASPPFRLHPDQVLLLSARNALMARLVLSGRTSADAMKRFQRLAFGAFGSIGFGARGSAAGPSPEQLRAAAGCLLEGSGILDLEGRVLNFLAAHAGSVKLLATADDLTRLLAQVRNVALACRSCLHRNVAALQDQADGLRGELAEATAAFEEVRARTDAVQAEVIAEIKAHLNTLRRRLFTHIVQTLDTDARAPPPHAPTQQAAASAAGSSPAQTSRWHRVREKFLSMFTASCSTLPPQPHGAGPSLVPEARSRSREELQALLLDLHDDLMGQIHSDVYDFWGVLEACAASRHSELLAALNSHLVALSRRVEGAVSEALEVQLVAADIRLRPPSAEQLHSDVQELIEKGIRESTEKHIRVGARTTTERVFRHPQGPPSLCRWGGYWVEVPRTRTVVETYTATVYSLRPDEITNHFIGLVDGAVTASEKALGAYVGALVERQLAAAKERIRDYGDRYLTVMMAALAASSLGAEYRSSALASVEGYLARLNDLLARAEAAQKDAEAAVPGGAAGLMDEVEVYDDEDDGSGGGGEYGQGYPIAQQEVDAVSAQERAGSEECAGEKREAEQMQLAESEVEGLAVAEALHGEGAGEAEVEAIRQATPHRSSSSSPAIPGIGDAVEGNEATPADDADAGQCIDDFSSSGEAAAATTGSALLPDLPRGEDLGDWPEPQRARSAEVFCVQHVVAVDAAQVAAAAGEVRPHSQDQRPSSSLLAGAGTFLAAGASQLLSGSTGCTTSSYAGTPFDYSRAFLEAMSSSEMAGGPGLHEPLAMIPLTTDGEGKGEGAGLRSGGAMPPSASLGTDTPRSGASEEWQLVGEDTLEAVEATEATCAEK